MASIDELRQSDQRSARNRGRFVVSGLVQRLSVLLLVLVSALGAVLLNELANRGQAKNAVPSFVQKELGAQRAAERLARKTGPKTTAKILSSGYEVSSPSGAVRLTQTGTAGKAWVRYANGTTRSTAFGNEAIVLGGDHADGEQYLTVHAHHGLHTWKWRLATGSLRPVLRPDGSVLVSPAHVVGGFRILPLEIFDTGGKNVTPAGAGWGLERKGGTFNLTLSLDDSELPVPYVIDPATETFRAAASANTGANATTLTITKPAALALNDVMIAAITARGGTNTFVCAPAGWTSIRADNSTTVLHQEVFWKAATAADVAAANFVFTFGTSATCATTRSEERRRYRCLLRHQRRCADRRKQRPGQCLEHDGHRSGRHERDRRQLPRRRVRVRQRRGQLLDERRPRRALGRSVDGSHRSEPRGLRARDGRHRRHGIHREQDRHGDHRRGQRRAAADARARQRRAGEHDLGRLVGAGGKRVRERNERLLQRRGGGQPPAPGHGDGDGLGRDERPVPCARRHDDRVGAHHADGGRGAVRHDEQLRLERRHVERAH